MNVDGTSIVVGVDGSQPARAALRWAAEHAERWGCELVVVHVLDEHPAAGGMLAGSAAVPPCDVDALLSTERRVAEVAAPSVSVRTELLIGDPVWSLARSFPAARAIVVGTHKTGFLRGSAFGSRSLQLAGVSLAPVIVVPSVGSLLGSAVVVGIDDSPDGEAALAFATARARDEGRELVLTRCVAARASAGLRSDTEEKAASAELAAARRRVALLAPDLNTRSRVVHGFPAQALIRASTRAALLVVGRSQSSASPAALGRVTHDVLLNMGVPTAVIGATPTRATGTSDDGTFDPGGASPRGRSYGHD